MGILNYNATPLDTGYSPAELRNNGRNIRSNLPTILDGRVPHYQKYEDRKLKEKQKQQYYHDGKGVAQLPAIRPGNTVRMKTISNRWTVKGTVLSKVGPRSYLIRTENGSILRRNRRDLLLTPETMSPIVSPEVEDTFLQDVSVEPEAPEQTPTPPQEVLMPQPAPQSELSEPSLAITRPRREIKKPDRLIENI
jgi:hypothetical protein